MRRKLLSLVFIAVFAVFLININLNLAVAEVLLNQPKAVYNVNDMMDVSATVRANLDTDSFVELSLICGGFSRLFYFSPVSLKDMQEEKIEKKLLLSRSFLKDMTGSCIISADYDDETYSSQNFKISDKIILNLDMDRTSVNPGEGIKVGGSAVKENGQNVEGVIEIDIRDTLIRTSDSISQGKIGLNFSFPDNAKSGNYIAKIIVYEKVGGEITNSAEKEVMLSVKQKPRKIEIITDKQSVIPGQEIKFKPVIYDQAGDLVDGNVKILVFNENGENYLGKVVKSGEELSVGFAENEGFGTWRIEASAFELTGMRNFEIEQLQKASFRILNNTLTVVNVGNVPYKKQIMVNIGRSPSAIGPLDLAVGEEKAYVLTGNEEGEYALSVSDGEQSVETSAHLLGGAIGVRELRGRLAIFNNYPIVWVFLILVFGMFIFTMSKRVIKKKYYGYAPSKAEMKGFERVSQKENAKKLPVMNIQNIKNVRDAEPALVMDGNKEEAGVVVLKIKNMRELEKNKLARETIERAVSGMNEHKGTINRGNDSYTGIFVPTLTKTFKNDLAAVKAATAIAAHLNEHNNKLKDKIEYGIGVNSGELAVRVIDGKLRFTPLGNTTSLAKRVADNADKTVLLTANTNKKICNDVKTLKQGEYYSISRIIEREVNKDFLNKFAERNKFG